MFKPVHYEEFYDFLIDFAHCYHIQTLDENQRDFIETFINTHSRAFQSTFYRWNIADLFDFTKRVVNQLIESLLTFNEFDMRPYSVFIQLLNKLISKYKLHIHTLNHDILFERLIENSSLQKHFSDGFTEMGSKFYGTFRIGEHAGYKFRLQFFNNKYEELISLYKLHGSIDQYKFHYRDRSKQDIVKRLPGMSTVDFYKELKNSDGALYYFNSWLEYHSYFLSGIKTKVRQYTYEYYNKPLFNHLKKNLNSSSLLIVIGYGFKDSKINDYIEKYFKSKKGSKLLIIDPYPNLPSFFQKRKDQVFNKKIELLDLKDFNRFLGQDLNKMQNGPYNEFYDFLEDI